MHRSGSMCCDSLIMSPRRLSRNVPLSLRPLRRSWIGTDIDEYERAEAWRRVGPRGGRDVGLGFGGGVDGRQLSPGEAVVSAGPGRRGGGGGKTGGRPPGGTGHTGGELRAGGPRPSCGKTWGGGR